MKHLVLLVLTLQAARGQFSCPFQAGLNHDDLPNYLNIDHIPDANYSSDEFLQGSVCPVAPRKCPRTNYQSLDGSCNNLRYPVWGMPFSRYLRITPPIYRDKKSAIPLTKSGKQLPNARYLSTKIFGDKEVPDEDFTLVNMQWAQMISHDMSRLAEFQHPGTIKARCCASDGKPINHRLAHRSCLPIIPPKNDPVYPAKMQCINFARTMTDKDARCPGQKIHVEQLTQVTAFLDLSLVYGNSNREMKSLRAHNGGKLRVETRSGKDWLPENKGKNTACDEIVNNPSYLAGDGRANQNPQMTVLQVIMMREHNRLAGKLSQLNKNWNDEKLFQEARRLNIAQYQHINYYEFLENLLGKENMIRYRKKYPNYMAHVNPGILNEHAIAAFRYFHSSIQGQLNLVSEKQAIVGTLRLSDWYCNTRFIENRNNFVYLARGLVTQPAHYTGLDFTKEQKHFLFRNGRPFGLDLRAIDIQRNRDHGLGTYNDVRAACGYKRATKWEDYLDFIVPHEVVNLRNVYESHEDVDLTVGAGLELHINGTLAGPTFLCVMNHQFTRSRVGDRFFYEHQNLKTSFTPQQLQQIRKANLARLFCDNVHDMGTVQPKAFRKVNRTNPRVPCSRIPVVNLAPWKERSIDTEEPVETYDEIVNLMAKTDRDEIKEIDEVEGIEEIDEVEEINEIEEIEEEILNIEEKIENFLHLD